MSPAPPPHQLLSLYFSLICLSFISLKILENTLGLDFNISNLINLLNFHKP